MKYQPHDYQKYATQFIIDHPTAAVFLQMGLGKSVITLTAIQELALERFEISRVLVIAPKRVAEDTWPREIQKWDHLRELTCSVAVGTEAERRAALRQNTLIHIINRENVQWLVEQSGLPFDYDMIVIDELSSFKSYQAKHFRSLMKVRPKVKRIVGLTGTPSSNGLMDLWAEFRLLDMGKRLGRFITKYREVFFLPDRRNAQQVFSWKPRPGAEGKAKGTAGRLDAEHPCHTAARIGGKGFHPASGGQQSSRCTGAGEPGCRRAEGGIRPAEGCTQHGTAGKGGFPLAPAAEGGIAEELLRRPEISYPLLAGVIGWGEEITPMLAERLETEIKYAGYIARQDRMIRDVARHEKTLIPADFEYADLTGLTLEAREKLTRIRPKNLGQAGRIPGVSPSDVAQLSIALQPLSRLRRQLP